MNIKILSDFQTPCCSLFYWGKERKNLYKTFHVVYNLPVGFRLGLTGGGSSQYMGKPLDRQTRDKINFWSSIAWDPAIEQRVPISNSLHSAIFAQWSILELPICWRSLNYYIDYYTMSTFFYVWLSFLHRERKKDEERKKVHSLRIFRTNEMFQLVNRYSFSHIYKASTIGPEWPWLFLQCVPTSFIILKSLVGF